MSIFNDQIQSQTDGRPLRKPPFPVAALLGGLTVFREAGCSRPSIANHSSTRRPRKSHILVLAPWSGPPSCWRGAAENNGTFLGGPGVTSVTQFALPGKSNDFCPVNQMISARLCHKLSLASWSGHRAHCEPAMRRTHLRAAEKVSFLPLGGLFWLSPLASWSGSGHLRFIPNDWRAAEKTAPPLLAAPFLAASRRISLRLAARQQVAPIAPASPKAAEVIEFCILEWTSASNRAVWRAAEKTALAVLPSWRPSFL